MTPKENAFIDAYVGAAHMNSTRAARIAEYAKPLVQGSQVRHRPHVAAEIERRLKENALPTEEVLEIIGQHAKGSMELFLNGNEIDLTGEEARANLHLVKRYKTKRKTSTSGTSSSEEVETEIELYDAQSAADKLAKAHGLYTERSHVVIEDASVAESLESKIAAMASRLNHDSEIRECGVAGESDGERS